MTYSNQRIGLILFLLLIFVACDKVVLRPEEGDGNGNVDSILTDEYLMDGKGGLFNNLKWYLYSLENHIVWPFFDIYSIKTEHGSYYIQIVEYYDHAGTAGMIGLNVKKHGEKTSQFVQIDAQGCGNPFSNPNYDACLSDPLLNGFTYLNLETLSAQKMTDAAGALSHDWDIAFKSTATKLNSGTSGPKAVVGALAKRFSQFFDSAGVPLGTALANAQEQSRARNAFADFSANSSLVYYLQDGIDRVIHEKFWLQTLDTGLRESLDDVWWKVRSHEVGEYITFSIVAIDEVIEGEHITTNLSIEENDGTAHLLSFSTATRLQNLCLNFSLDETFSCTSSRSDWDIKFTIVNLFRDGVWSRDWRVFTNKGAKGPFIRSEL